MKHASLPLLRRREFITLLGGAAAAWPVAARAQQAAMPVIGFLTMASDTLKRRRATVSRGAQKLGWVDGHNVQCDRSLGRRTLRRSVSCASRACRAAARP